MDNQEMIRKLNFKSYSEIDPSDGEDSDHLSKNHNFDAKMASFDRKTVQFLQNFHFHRNVLKFVLCFNPRFDAKSAAMKTNADDTPYNTNWYVSTSVTFKTLITQHKYRLSLRHTKKRYVIQSRRKEFINFMFDI